MFERSGREHILKRQPTDQTGKVFGHLTITSFHEARGAHKYWWATCTCGSEDIYRYGDFIRTDREPMRDCGCGGEILWGKTIGNFKVLSRTGEETRTERKKYNCQCTECGTHFVATAPALRGNTKSAPHCCPWETREVGKHYGRLTVISFAGINTQRNITWNCICECGTETTAATPELHRGNKRSCGCLQRELATARGLAGITLNGTVEVPSYMAMHSRIRKAKGKASLYECIECGDPAQDWAYDHQDLNEVVGETICIGQAYSLKPEHYLPMCKKCHGAFDRDWDNGYQVVPTV